MRGTGFGEDRSQIRTSSGPRIMAGLRNLVITILRLAWPPASPSPCATTLGAQPPPRTIMNC